MDRRRQCRRSTEFATRMAVAIVAFTALLTAPAFAQDQDPDLSELPSGPPDTAEETEADPDAGTPGLDLSGVVEVDDDGNIIWNVETDTVDADQVVVEPTAIPEAGITGTGDLDRPAKEGRRPLQSLQLQLSRRASELQSRPAHSRHDRELSETSRPRQMESICVAHGSCPGIPRDAAARTIG